MGKIKYIVIAGAVLVAGIIAFIIFHQSEEAKVKKQFNFLAEKMNKTPNETPLISVARANRIKNLFAETCTVHAPAYSFSRNISSQDLSSLVLTTRSRYSEMSLEFYDFVIEFPEGGSADVNLTASMTGKLTTGEYVDDIHELKCKLKKTEDIWLLKEIEVVEVLKK
ncbi:MAG: hypothetical protein PVH99_08985 [Desulfobacteraceae bacterium]